MIVVINMGKCYIIEIGRITRRRILEKKRKRMVMW